MIGREIIELNVTDSTNSYARNLIKKGALEGTVVVAERQTAGRGRNAKKWISPNGGNLYLSICLKPIFKVQKATIVVLLTSVAIVETLRELYNVNAAIKWPNDILIDGKKVSGVLIEVSTCKEEIEFMVVGVGINVNMDVKKYMPEILHDRVVSVREAVSAESDVLDKKLLLDKFFTVFEKWYEKISNPGEIVDAWRNYSCTLKRKVKIQTINEVVFGKAIDIMDNGELLIETRPGVINKISTGEIVEFL